MHLKDLKGEDLTVLMNCLFSIYLGYINVCITLAGPLKELAPTELPSLWRKLLDTSVSEAERQSDPYDLPFRLSLSLSQYSDMSKSQGQFWQRLLDVQLNLMKNCNGNARGRTEQVLSGTKNYD